MINDGKYSYEELQEANARNHQEAWEAELMVARMRHVLKEIIKSANKFIENKASASEAIDEILIEANSVVDLPIVRSK